MHMSNRNQRQSAGHWIFVGIMIGLGLLLFQLFALPILVCMPIVLVAASGVLTQLQSLEDRIRSLPDPNSADPNIILKPSSNRAAAV